ncbi:MAG: hypothetical protein ABI461_21510 [Polyangiaceae bacterium]
MTALDAQAIFVGYFLPLYPPDAFADLASARATDANPAKNKAIFDHIQDAANIFAARAPALFGAGGAKLDLDFSDASVHRLSAAITKALRDRWRDTGKPGTADSELFNVVVHGAAYVGECARRGRTAEWSVRRPLWESVVVLESRAGTARLAVFHWWLKSLADDAFENARGGTLADRYRTHVETPTFDADALPVFLAAKKDDTERKLPRIAKPRYDVLYKYIKAHLPEIRDVGADFPTAERFDEFDFRWIDFFIVGEGRMLLMAAAGPTGVHLFWLGKSGFEKSAFVPCDAFPEPIVKTNGDKIVLVLRTEKKDVIHEMLWWGV